MGKKNPRQQRLPGTADAGIKALDELGAELKDVQDERMRLTQRELKLRKNGLELMHKYNKTKYEYAGLTLEVKPGEETLHVSGKRGRPSKDKSE